jgi:hypothetical protein
MTWQQTSNLKKGKLVIDVTEGDFFSTARHTADPAERVKYYKTKRPLSLAFIKYCVRVKTGDANKDYYAAMHINGLPLKKRKGVFCCKPMFKFFGVNFDRQNIRQYISLQIPVQNRVKAFKVSTEDKQTIPDHQNSSIIIQ